MKTVNHKDPLRWVLLRHIDAPDDLRGIHFDLLLEDQEFCRTWRLSDIPLLEGPYVDAFYTAPHHLDWLEIKQKALSGNRGFAARIKQGTFLNSLPSLGTSSINLSLKWDDVECKLLIDENGCRIFRKKVIISSDLQGLEFL